MSLPAHIVEMTLALEKIGYKVLAVSSTQVVVCKESESFVINITSSQDKNLGFWKPFLFAVGIALIFLFT